MSMNLKGLLLPLTTPFSSEENVDAEGLIRNIRSWNETGVSGYLVLGSTGERVNLSEREYAEVIETARRVTPASLNFIVGAGQQSTRGTINEIRVAASSGAEA